MIINKEVNALCLDLIIHNTISVKKKKPKIRITKSLLLLSINYTTITAWYNLSLFFSKQLRNMKNLRSTIPMVVIKP